MDLAQHLPDPHAFPWRKATVIAGAVALVELVALIAIGAVKLADHAKAAASPAAARHAAAMRPAVHRSAHVRRVAPPTHPLQTRSHVAVLVLNGNGRTGAASAEAARLQSRGYRIGGATNATRHDYARSMVMYVPGWLKEARRLARDTGIRMIAPVDGLRPAALRGSKLVVLLGN